MLTISGAFEHLLATVVPLEPTPLPLGECLGLTLAEDVASVSDSPPFDKVLMDGYAVRSSDLVGGAAVLHVVEVVTAGRVASKSVGPGEAIQVMTGAPLPDGADLVVKIEETSRDQDHLGVSTTSTLPGTNILRRGTSVRSGDLVLRAGQKLIGPQIGALAELGRATVLVHPRPAVAVLATGDELVPVDRQPGPGQIRNSNESMLVAQIQAAGAIPVPLGIARDDRDELRAKILLGLQSDLLVLSGGVSAGILDLVPGELAAAGVKQVFHKVELKPGKPIWFGHRPSVDGEPPLKNVSVFGLPGNPVSSLVCCELFVRTAIRRLMGEPDPRPRPISARLEHDYAARADRPTWHPARLTWSPSGPVVALVKWHGSSDLCGTVSSNAMAFLPGDERQYRSGDALETIAW